MNGSTRRQFLKRGAIGAGLLGASLLPAGARATEESGHEDPPSSTDTLDSGRAVATEDNILGPYYQPSAPYRAKISPVGADGGPLLISGRVWSLKTRRPLAGTLLEIWQADDSGRYYEPDEGYTGMPEAVGTSQRPAFRYRARLRTGEDGFYEYETILPGRYENEPGVWRPRHIHYQVTHPGYRTLVTQLYFKGDPYNETDAFIKKSLIITLRMVQEGGAAFQAGMFDIILDAEKKG